MEHDPLSCDPSRALAAAMHDGHVPHVCGPCTLQARAKELRLELLNSERLASHFEVNILYRMHLLIGHR